MGIIKRHPNQTPGENPIKQYIEKARLKRDSDIPFSYTNSNLVPKEHFCRDSFPASVTGSGYHISTCWIYVQLGNYTGPMTGNY